MTGVWKQKFATAMGVADAVLYEGYLLYPYRPTSRKNQFRWQFGVLAPRDFVQRVGSESSRSRCEFIVKADASDELALSLRFLRVRRTTKSPSEQSGFLSDGNSSNGVDQDFKIGQPYEWEEGIPVEVYQSPQSLKSLVNPPRRETLSVGLDGGSLGTDIDCPNEHGLDGQSPLSLSVVTTAQLVDNVYSLWRIVVEVENLTPISKEIITRSDAIPYSAVGTHFLLGMSGGRFISSLDPPIYAKKWVESCTSEGLYPVLMGAEGVDDVLLCSPIVLYDRPSLATASKGDFFDATEIDEMLTLRVLTLTDEEKMEARFADPRAAAILEMCEGMAPEEILAMHGEMCEIDTGSSSHSGSVSGPLRSSKMPEEGSWWNNDAEQSIDPFSEVLRLGDKEVGSGTLVKLRPFAGRDAQDLFLAGRVATVAGIFRDVDGGIHLGVTVNDDPANDLFISQGRYLFFAPEEIEILGELP